MGEAVVSGSDSAKVLEAAEHAFDGVAVTIEDRRETVFPAAIGLGRDIGGSALAFDFAANGVTVIAFVAVQDRGRGHAFEKGVCGNAVGDLAARQQEGDRAAETIGQRVDFGRPPTARTADGLREFPPFPPEAQR